MIVNFVSKDEFTFCVPTKKKREIDLKQRKKNVLEKILMILHNNGLLPVQS